VQYFAAGHLNSKPTTPKKKTKNISSTYIAFSSNGVDLLVNLGGEQIYLFDINNRREVTTYKTGGSIKNGCQGGASNGFINGKRHREPSDGEKPEAKKQRSEKVYNLKTMVSHQKNELN